MPASAKGYVQKKWKATESPDVHLRYALRVGPDRPGAQFVGHSGGCLGTPICSFDKARIWVNRWDAERYIKHQNVARVRSKLEVAEVTCCVGAPYAIFTEAP